MSKSKEKVLAEARQSVRIRQKNQAENKKSQYDFFYLNDSDTAFISLLLLLYFSVVKYSDFSWLSPGSPFLLLVLRSPM